MKRGKTAFLAPFRINFPFLSIPLNLLFPEKLQNAATPATLAVPQ